MPKTDTIVTRTNFVVGNNEHIHVLTEIQKQVVLIKEIVARIKLYPEIFTKFEALKIKKNKFSKTQKKDFKEIEKLVKECAITLNKNLSSIKEIDKSGNSYDQRLTFIKNYSNKAKSDPNSSVNKEYAFIQRTFKRISKLYLQISMINPDDLVGFRADKLSDSDSLLDDINLKISEYKKTELPSSVRSSNEVNEADLVQRLNKLIEG